MTPTKQEDNAKIAPCSHGDTQFLGKYTEFISQVLDAAQESRNMSGLSFRSRLKRRHRFSEAPNGAKDVH